MVAGGVIIITSTDQRGIGREMCRDSSGWSMVDRDSTLYDLTYLIRVKEQPSQRAGAREREAAGGRQSERGATRASHTDGQGGCRWQVGRDKERSRPPQSSRQSSVVNYQLSVSVLGSSRHWSGRMRVTLPWAWLDHSRSLTPPSFVSLLAQTQCTARTR
jgi:hypothetical protein